ncbi:GntR family transcriptional regulator [Micromonospora rifamycinica]|uniref:GntR family transcriptional regulator n=1 Tax=Micromonospora rifamycinica TaxID=291594 RepID=UPI0012FD0AD3|nr:GntR family transcriptional regulator [Micromonospora rifamycinica]
MPTPHYGQPRYRTIADELRHRITSGAIPPGTLLPTESALTAEFRASRGTVRQAVAVLREERLVTTEHGRGTYASPPQLGSEQNASSETQTRQRLLTADPDLAALFGVEVGTALVEQEIITRTARSVHMVVRTYRLPR